jgi:hypothetical protein
LCSRDFGGIRKPCIHWRPAQCEVVDVCFALETQEAKKNFPDGHSSRRGAIELLLPDSGLRITVQSRGLAFDRDYDDDFRPLVL